MDTYVLPDPSFENDLTKFRWSVDNFALTEEGMLLIFGWALHDSEDIASLKMTLRFVNGTHEQFDIVYGTERTDVYTSISDNPRALMCGYYFFGYTPRMDVVSMSLEARLANGSHALLPTNCAIPPLRSKPDGYNLSMRARTYVRLVRRACSFIRSGRFLDFAAAAKRYLRGKPRVITDGINSIHRTVAKHPHTELIIDHDLGGGANHYRQSLVKELLSTGTAVLILTFHVPTLRYALECRTQGRTARIAIEMDEFFAALPEFTLRRIHYNNSVSFAKQLALIEALSAFSYRSAVPLSFYMHDFHCICPSHFLLDSQGQYCGVPDVERCRSCLPKMKDGLVSLFAERDIQLWRRRWLSFLSRADEIVFFSNSSKDLLVRAYPQLARHPALKLRPHDISDFQSAPVQFDLRSNLNIGIVGRINAHKGANIVEQMATAVDKRDAGEHITILGALDGRQKSPSLVVTGSYERANLASLMAKHSVNMIAFTSIWPETFSFVVAEVMSLGLPIICFDLGAPAERVKNYSLGRVIPLCDGATLIRAALAFRDDLLSKMNAPKEKLFPLVQLNQAAN